MAKYVQPVFVFEWNLIILFNVVESKLNCKSVSMYTHYVMCTGVCIVD